MTQQADEEPSTTGRTASTPPGVVAQLLLILVLAATATCLTWVILELHERVPESARYGEAVAVGFVVLLVVSGRMEPKDGEKEFLLKLLRVLGLWGVQEWGRWAVVLMLSVGASAVGYYLGPAAIHAFTVACNGAEGLRVQGDPAECDGNKSLQIWSPRGDAVALASTVQCVWRRTGEERIAGVGVREEDHTLACASPCPSTHTWTKDGCLPSSPAHPALPTSGPTAQTATPPAGSGSTARPAGSSPRRSEGIGGRAPTTGAGGAPGLPMCADVRTELSNTRLRREAVSPNQFGGDSEKVRAERERLQKIIDAKNAILQEHQCTG